MSPATVLQYESPWPVYAMDWCKTPGPNNQSHRSAFRIALGSFTEDYRNRLAVIGLPDERLLIEDEGYAEGYSNISDFVMTAEIAHGYPVTKVAWEPSRLSTHWQHSSLTEILATTGDSLRLWEYASEPERKPGAYVGRNSGYLASRLSQMLSLSSVRRPSFPTSAPITSFSWNTLSPNLIVTSSIDTTCTVWDISTSTAVTQLIAHDREVYDVAWVPGSTDSFVSVGADGSLRAFDLRSLEHSTILYETPQPKSPANPNDPTAAAASRPASTPLLRTVFNPLDTNYLATFHADSPDVQILDMRSPGKPVIQLKGHRAPVNAIGWSSHEGSMLATVGEDSQALVWDLANGILAPPRAQSRTPGLTSPRPEAPIKQVVDPMLVYPSATEINNLTWSPPIPGMNIPGGGTTPSGEWLAIASSRIVTALKL
ncbi:hypothetical protein BOTBODRAFT_99548 [Botryobasidium botryosum FD-172 SS1]|uniref:Histone-binding protein RBBP4 N-terminal domain-containing protein n=1 Tax=Botryobasidium botryosum (strain FD-172 SS1) TaxID=930990 RepID=A0A067N318_BOTB1|nr:hypothetical protein BOTBODRAFT_99548 [Botryobasidium botryosum FD-172 SS1]